MTRVVAGAARGRRLAVPPGAGTRPTSDRAREALFSTLEAMLGSLDGLRFLDLYAGSGAVGLEALSRGAAHATLVEADPRVAGVVRDNAASLALPGAHVVTGRVERVVAQPAPAPYDVVFADPPYVVADGELAEVLSRLRDSSWLTADAVVVLERPTRFGWSGWPLGFTGERSRRYGEATLWYGRASGTG